VTAHASRARRAGDAGCGLGAGALAGLALGVADALAVARSGLGAEAQALWAAPLGWGALLAPLGLAAGLALGATPLAPTRWPRALARWAAPRVALSLWVAAVIAGAIAGRYASPGRAAPAPPVPPALADAPNLLLVVAGALRADALSCAGDAGAVPAPALCRLAADGGTRYDGFTHAASTRPAVATLLTSLLPSRHGATSAEAALPGERDTLAEALAARGYATGAVVASPALGPESGLAQGFGEYRAIGPGHAFGAADSSARLVLHRLLRGAGALVFAGLREDPLAADADAVNLRALDFLERHRAARFFLFLHYADAEPPYVRHPHEGAGQTGAAARRALYHGEVAFLAGRFERLLAKLEALGLDQDAVIVFAGDHGAERGERDGSGRGRTLYDEELRVPLFVKWRAGERLAPPALPGLPARLLDVAPTLLARAGAPAPPAMQGLDLAADPARRRDADRLVFAEEDGLRAVRTERWKWIEAAHGLPARALFDLAADPGETENVAEREPGTWAELRRQADALQAGGRRGTEGWGPSGPIR
jgi:arylsulfatase A-like enzyme